jgi:hypothetical protein
MDRVRRLRYRPLVLAGHSFPRGFLALPLAVTLPSFVTNVDGDVGYLRTGDALLAACSTL